MPTTQSSFESKKTKQIESSVYSAGNTSETGKSQTAVTKEVAEVNVMFLNIYLFIALRKNSRLNVGSIIII